MLSRVKVAGAILSVLFALPSALPCCCASLYFYIWGLAQCLRFYWTMLNQREITHAHVDIERQEQIREAGGDGRTSMERFAGAFSDDYSAEHVNERNFARAEAHVEAVDRMAGARCLGCWVPDLSSHIDHDKEGFRLWANFWVSI